MTLLHSETNPLTVSAPINEAKLKTSEKILLLFDFMDTNDAFSSNLQHGRFVGCIILKQSNHLLCFSSVFGKVHRTQPPTGSQFRVRQRAEQSTSNSLQLKG